VCAKLDDLPAGVYHYDPRANVLHELAQGDHRQVLVEASAGEPALASAPAIVICTSAFWRNAWKYGARAYRHIYWDARTVLANMYTTASAHDLQFQLVHGFIDQLVNQLLGIDTQQEVAVCLVAVGQAQHQRMRVAAERRQEYLP